MAKSRAKQRRSRQQNQSQAIIENDAQSNHSEIDQQQQPEGNHQRMNEYSVRVPFPQFKHDDIEAWFRRVENWFEYNKVNDEKGRYSIIASQIDHPTVTNLHEMLNPPIENPYTTVKAKIISLFEITTSSKINKLLSDCQLGDLKPSQLLSEMKRIGGTVGDDILRNLWSKQLPIHIRIVVAAATTSSLDEVSLIADAVIDVVGTNASSNINQVNQVASATTGKENSVQKTEIESLCAAVNQLTRAFGQMQNQNQRSRSNSKQNDRQRDRSSSVSLRPDRICRYHRKFGEKAYLCTQPCSFVPRNDNEKN